jgi:hypothetical protein
VWRWNRSDFLVKQRFKEVGSLEAVMPSVLVGDVDLQWFPTHRTGEAILIGFDLLFLHSRNTYHGSLNPSYLLFDTDERLRLDLSRSVHFRNDAGYDPHSRC